MVPIFPGEWGPLLSNFRECPVKLHLDLFHRYLSTKENKMEQSSGCLSVQIQNGKRRSEQGRFTFNNIHRYLRDSYYPDGYTKPDKLALRK